MANSAHTAQIARRAPVSLAGFMIIAPCGLLYFPPCPTLAEAYAEIRERSLYDGEPGWTIQQYDNDGEPIGNPTKTTTNSRRFRTDEDSSREVS